MQMSGSSPEFDALRAVTLDDRFTCFEGQLYMSGIQALVRLPIVQRIRDLQAGHNTAGFISGYRGSPLGGYDQALWGAKAHLQQHHVVFQPGVNEELAATAVWGTQQIGLFEAPARYDGVFGIWYGKGPGVDRSVDVLKHANMAGTSPLGGVIAVAGDDHVAKSSSTAHQSDHVFKACGMPVFYPESVQGILDLGLHALAMSRYAGVWVGLKTIQEVVESSATVDADPHRIKIVLPDDFQVPSGGVHIRWPDSPLEQEARLMEQRMYAALAYVRANRLNHTVIQGPNDRIGIMASGKAYSDTCQALQDLGLTQSICRQVGIRLHKVNVVWPLEASITREFAQGLREILVVEEKRQMIEYQLKEELYNWRADVRPDVIGKFNLGDGDHSSGEWSRSDPSQNWLLRGTADLNPAIIAKAIAKRLAAYNMPADVRASMVARVAAIEQTEKTLQALTCSTGERLPWFCSGCPHNTSTRVPEGSRALAGIGCHYMAMWMDRSTATFTQMGGEGVTWVGQSPFMEEKHVFANMGDGTWFHSGILAIRQSVAAGVNITYKLLYNDAVAMTGGQQVGERAEGLSVAQIVKSCVAEGVVQVVVVTDEPEKYASAVLESGVKVHHRDQFDVIQLQLREVAGTTVLVYDQTCATEKRRRRKSGQLPQQTRAVVINEAVCEGCGDCSVKSNCLSVEPVRTALGSKRRINQSSCNNDETCLKGFCPSFVVLENARPRKAARARVEDDVACASGVGERAAISPNLPQPQLADCSQGFRLVVAGVGGTGVITLGQVLGMAAHLEGKAVITQDAAGLAQKGGSTWSHVQIAQSPDVLHATKVDAAKADLILACDGIVAASQVTRALMQPGQTRVLLNIHETPTAALIHHAQWEFPLQACKTALGDSAAIEQFATIDAQSVAEQSLGDAIYANAVMLGFAWQQGWLPVSRQAIAKAFELNRVQVDNNQRAFELGRQWAHDQQTGRVRALASKLTEHTVTLHRPTDLSHEISQRHDDLVRYQSVGYANRYSELMREVVRIECETCHGSERLSRVVALQLYRLMAFKDEYEVARLHADPQWLDSLQKAYEPGFRISYYLAAPILSTHDAAGYRQKRRYGAWFKTVFGIMQHLKFVRGTWFDPFGWQHERKVEKALSRFYPALLALLMKDLTADRLELAVQIVKVAEQIRGYGHIKQANLRKAAEQWQALLAVWAAQTDSSITLEDLGWMRT